MKVRALGACPLKEAPEKSKPGCSSCGGKCSNAVCVSDPPVRLLHYSGWCGPFVVLARHNAPKCPCPGLKALQHQLFVHLLLGEEVQLPVAFESCPPALALVSLLQLDVELSVLTMEPKVFQGPPKVLAARNGKTYALHGVCESYGACSCS